MTDEDDHTDEILALIEEDVDVRAVLFHAIGACGPISSVEEASEDIQRFLTAAYIIRAHKVGVLDDWLTELSIADQSDWQTIAARILGLEANAAAGDPSLGH